MSEGEGSGYMSEEEVEFDHNKWNWKINQAPFSCWNMDQYFTISVQNTHWSTSNIYFVKGQQLFLTLKKSNSLVEDTRVVFAVVQGRNTSWSEAEKKTSFISALIKSIAVNEDNYQQRWLVVLKTYALSVLTSAEADDGWSTI